MLISTRVTVRRLIAGVSVAALSASVLAISGSANAAAPVVVTGADIAPNEDTYAGWHQGDPAGAENFAVTADGLSLRGKAQVINGYENNSSVIDTRNADLSTVLPEVEYTVGSGDIWLQVPLFFTNEDNPTSTFATLRPASAADQGANDVELTDLWRSSRQLSGDIRANTPYPLGDILAELDDYKTIAFGVFTDTNRAGSVEDLTWDGTTYVFAPAAPTVQTVTDSDIAPDETTYAGWHQGYAGAIDRHQVNTAGLKLTGSSQVIKGYENNAANVDEKNADLTFAVRNASFTVVDGSVNFQIPVFFDNGSGVKFTTLRTAAQHGPGTHTIALTDEWISSGPISGALPANTATPLSGLIQGLGSYKVLAFGVHQATTGSATVSDIAWEGTKYVFSSVPATVVDVAVKEGHIAPDESTYAGWHQGYADAAGNHKVTAAGLELTGKSQVIKGYEDNAENLDAKNVDLRQALLSASYTVNSGSIWFQVPLFFEDEAASDGISFTTLRPAEPATLGTNTFDLDDRWVSSRALGGIAANTPVRLGDIVAALPNYKVLAFGVLTDSDGAVADITWDGAKYSFEPEPVTEPTVAPNHAPTLADVRVTTRVGVPVTVKLAPKDVDGDTVTLSASGSGAKLAGTTLRVTVPKTSRAARTVKVTAKDGRGGVTTATVRVSVAKATTSVTLASPKQAKAGKRFNAKVKVNSTANVRGGRVDLYVAGKKVGSAKVNAAGRATITSQKLSKKLKGNRNVVVKFRATSLAHADNSNIRKIRIR